VGVGRCATLVGVVCHLSALQRAITFVVVSGGTRIAFILDKNALPVLTGVSFALAIDVTVSVAGQIVAVLRAVNMGVARGATLVSVVCHLSALEGPGTLVVISGRTRIAIILDKNALPILTGVSFALAILVTITVPQEVIAVLSAINIGVGGGTALIDVVTVLGALKRAITLVIVGGGT